MDLGTGNVIQTPPERRAASTPMLASSTGLHRLIAIRSQSTERQIRALKKIAESGIERILLEARQRLGRSELSSGDLDQLFISPIVARGLRPRPAAALKRDGRETEDWASLRDRLRRAVILGTPGFGKTTLLWNEAVRRNQHALALLRNPHVVLQEVQPAVLVHANEVATWLSAAPVGTEMLAVLVDKLLKRFGLEGEETARILLLGKLREGDCLLAIDALDEVPPDLRDRLEMGVRELGGACGKASLLLSSRLAGYAGPPISIPEENQLELLAFDQSRMRRAVGAWFGSDQTAAVRIWAHLIKRRALLQDLASPLLLRLSCQSAAEALGRGDPLPQRECRGELYQSFLENSVAHWALRASPKLTRTQAAQFQDYIGTVCLELGQRDPGRMSWEPALLASALRSSQKEFPAFRRRPDPLGDLCASGLMVPSGPDGVQTPMMFTHRTFGEFLAGQALAKGLISASAAWELVDQTSWDPRWEEVIRFAA